MLSSMTETQIQPHCFTKVIYTTILIENNEEFNLIISVLFSFVFNSPTVTIFGANKDGQ